MYDEYLTNYQTYKGKYGSKVAIFLMVGIFYEMYDERNPETGETKTSFNELVDLLGLKVSVKKGEGPSGPEYDGLVAGIPDYSVHKWAGKLTSLGWTVVLIEQVKNPAGKVVRREVQRILTPGTHLEANEGIAGSDAFLTFVSLQGLNIAAVALDLSTGHLHVFETVATGTEDAWTCNDIVQFMELYPPREVLWTSGAISGTSSTAINEQKLKGILGCTATTTFHQRSPLTTGAWLTPAFREEYLRSKCGLKSLLPTHAALHIGPGSHTETALLSLLNALEELWPSMNLGTLLVYPWIPGSMMHLGENALVQLHMIQDSVGKDVLSLFSKCSTPMGRRGLRQRLLKPSADANTIRENLDAVEAWTLKDRDEVRRRLRTMADLDRLYRRIQQGLITATDLMNLDSAMACTQRLSTSEADIQDSMAYISAEVLKIFDMGKAYQASEDTSLFLKGLCPELDSIEAKLQEQFQCIQSWIDAHAKLCSLSPDIFKVEFRERSLVIKAPRAAVQALKLSNKLPAKTTATTNKTASYLESSELDHLYASISRFRDQLKRGQGVALVEKGTVLASAIFDPWHKVSQWITAIDVNQTLAMVALERGYVKPVITQGESSVVIEGLRHPLLEAQDRRIPYVQHSIALGTEGSQGWLLYGLNASGKSSLMRATGLAVLLAQGGSFVPATKMVLAPFQSLHTRIINTDNLWMGLSSFAVEMSEMRDIFRVAGPRSLVLGDELCSGTETTSATALVAAGIRGLLGRGAKCLFATHLHSLMRIPEIARHPALKVWHLHVEYDRLKDKLIYDRTLKTGSGSSLYGLEVAKAMRIPADILEDAIRFRKSLAGEAELSESVGSAWNSSVVRRKCQKCGIQEVAGLEVHHIRERAAADSQTGRLVDGSSVHALANLAVLCEACHLQHHRGQIEVLPMIQTSDGPEESVRESSVVSESSRKSKWSASELATIETVCRQYQNLSNARMSDYLLNQHEIRISSASLKKFRA